VPAPRVVPANHRGVQGIPARLRQEGWQCVWGSGAMAGALSGEKEAGQQLVGLSGDSPITRKRAKEVGDEDGQGAKRCRPGEGARSSHHNTVAVSLPKQA